MSQPAFFGIGIRRPLAKLSGTTLNRRHRDSIFEMCLGMSLLIPCRKCSDSIPSPAGEQFSFKAQIYFTTTEVDSLILYVERCCCLSLTNFLDAVITSLVTVGALNLLV